MTKEDMVRKFQCPGCVNGFCFDTCKMYEWSDVYFSCVNHVLGTMNNGYLFALGMPKGFNKPALTINNKFENKIRMRLYVNPDDLLRNHWNKLNIPVWSMEKDGFLFVRTYMPRLNYGIVDVINGGKRKEMCPNSIDVVDFINDID